MGKNLDNGTFCGDKRFTLTWMLVLLVFAAAWLSDLGGRRARR